MQRHLLIIAVLLVSGFLSTETDAQRIFLVSVGVSDYPGVKYDLRLPAHDAAQIYRLYRKNSLASSVLLTNSQATKTRILYKSQKLFSKAKPDDIVVMFLSCHGFQGGFGVYDDYIYYEDIRAVFSSCKAKNKMIFVNSCHSGDFRENKRKGNNNSLSNVLLFLSSRNDEYSWESSDMKNSFFAACLLRALKGGADYNKDRIITAKELFQAVSKGVKELSNDMQHPVMWGNFDGNMPVMIWK